MAETFVFPASSEDATVTREASSVGAAIKTIGPAWLVSLAISVISAALAAANSNRHGKGFHPVSSWYGYDFGWYVQIASRGYDTVPDASYQSAWPFFPLYPMILRGGHAIGLSYQTTALVVSMSCTAVALIGVWSIARRRFGERAARYAVWVCAIAPFSFVLWLGYPSSLFLAASVWMFVLAERQRWVIAGLVGLVATSSRPNGVIPLAALAIAMLFGSVSDGGAIPLFRRIVRFVLFCAPSAMFLVLWLGFVRDKTGDALFFYDNKHAWEEVSFVEYLRGERWVSIPHVSWALIGLSCIVAVWLLGRARLAPLVPFSWMLFAFAYILPPVFFGMQGVGRYTTECFCVSVCIGVGLSGLKKPLPQALLGASAAAMALIATYVASRYFLP